MGSELRVRGREVVNKVRKGSQVDVGVTQGQEPERAGAARVAFSYLKRSSRIMSFHFAL